MTKRHRVGVIGLGIMGRRFMPHIAAHPEFSLSAVWDPSQDACEKAWSLGTGARLATSAADVIDASDVVYLACPPIPRHAYALETAAAGKAMFLEKPFGVDLAAGRALLEALEKAEARVAVNFTQAAGAALATVLADEAMGAPRGIDIVVTYSAWPRAWQREADWLRFAAEGGFTREVISHFLFFSARVLGPLRLAWAQPKRPADASLCETHMAARLETAAGLPVNVFAAVGGAQPDRQELTVKGVAASWRVTDFYALERSTGGPFEPMGERPADPRAISLRAQLDALDAMLRGAPHKLATAREAFAVQELVEAMLAGGPSS